VGRNTQGVRLIRLEEGDQLSGLERIDGLAGDGGDADAGDAGAGDADAGDGEPGDASAGDPPPAGT
jgi:hypothetical protein